MATSEGLQNIHRSRGKSMRSDKDEQMTKAKEMEERDARINYALDMVVHDLVGQGHLQPAKSYLLKTTEMKEHIGRMCVELDRRRKEEDFVGKSSKTRHVPKSFSASNKPVVKTSGNLSKIVTTNNSKRDSHGPTNLDYTDDVKKKLLSSRSANLPTPSSNQNRREVKQNEPWVTPRDITDKPHRVSVVPKVEHHSSKDNRRIKKELSPPSDLVSQRNIAPAQAYRTKIDMTGFSNDEISLDLDDRRLIITASRQKKGQQNARKVTEVIDIPEGVKLENLKIGRRLDGSLLIEEFVSGNSQNF